MELKGSISDREFNGSQHGLIKRIENTFGKETIPEPPIESMKADKFHQMQKRRIRHYENRLGKEKNVRKTQSPIEKIRPEYKSNNIPPPTESNNIPPVILNIVDSPRVEPQAHIGDQNVPSLDQDNEKDQPVPIFLEKKSTSLTRNENPEKSPRYMEIPTSSIISNNASKIIKNEYEEEHKQSLISAHSTNGVFHVFSITMD